MNGKGIKGILIILWGLSLVVFVWFTRNKCNVSLDSPKPAETLPVIYAITPTYYRPLQKAELTRLSQTLMLVPNVYWVIVEDADEVSDLVRGIRKESGLYKRSVQLQTATPTEFKLKKKDPHWSKPRGVDQRNTGLEWVRRRIMDEASSHRPTIVYFMDDDNTYSIELFKEMSKIELGRVGVWPVGLVGGLMVEKPLVNASGVVTGFNAAWRPDRPFAIDMAGFAFSGELLLTFPKAKFSNEAKGGFQETDFLSQLTKRTALQPLADWCTKVLVWHTRSEPPNLNEEKKLIKKGEASDKGMEV